MPHDDSEPSAYTRENASPRASISAPIAPILPPNKPQASSNLPSNPPSHSRAIVRDWNGRVLAFIALALALIGLAYNTWRNETTESHRNIRQSCFLILEESAALQQIVHVRFYGGDRSTTTWVTAWGKASLIRDLGMLAPPRTGQEAQQVFDTWSKRAQDIDARNPLAEDEMSDALERLRRQTLEDLRELD
jgi:hypothetical protein